MQWKGVSPVLAKLSGESGPKDGNRHGSRSDREQLAVCVLSANQHAENESKAENDRKVFFGGASRCMIPLLERSGESQDALAS
jgi:hypothetical protein